MYHRVEHKDVHSFPTRRSSDLTEIRRTGYPEQLIRPGEVSGIYERKTTDADGKDVINYEPNKFEPLSDVKNDIVSRVPYPTNESTLNGSNFTIAVSNLQDGTNNYYTKMFWDVRTSTYEHPANK